MKVIQKIKKEQCYVVIGCLCAIINIFVFIAIAYIKIGNFGFYQTFILLDLTKYSILLYGLLFFPIVYILIAIGSIRKPKAIWLVVIATGGVITHLLMRWFLGSDILVEAITQEVMGIPIQMKRIMGNGFVYVFITYAGMLLCSGRIWLLEKRGYK